MRGRILSRDPARDEHNYFLIANAHFQLPIFNPETPGGVASVRKSGICHWQFSPQKAGLLRLLNLETVLLSRP